MKKPIEYVEIDIEHAALGLLLRNNAAVVEFCEDDFAHDTHRRFLSKMKALFAENQTFKVMDFANYADENLPEDMNAMRYLQNCGDIAFDSSHAQAINYRDYLRNLAQKRHIIELTEAIHWKLEESSASDILQWLHQQTLNCKSFDLI